MDAPRYSIIVPALNEAESLPAQLDALKCDQLGDGRTELLVVDGGSTDGTAALAAAYGRVIASPRGRARQMNTGAAAARGDVLIFLHADTRLPPDALLVIERALADSRVVGGAFRLRFDTNAPAYRLVAATTTLRGVTRHSFTGDQAYVVKREAFERVGGFPDQPLMEDLEIVKRLRHIGRFVLFPAAVVTSARRHQQLGLGKTLLLMGLLRTLYALGTPPERLRQIYLDIR
jgi:rSAM/selenodomain-associated transferase 2